jgi:transcriptional regulator with XRE-family HTH domain
VTDKANVPEEPPEEPPWAALGRKIVAARVALGLSQVALANKLDVSRRTMSRYENGEYAPPREQARKLEAELGIPILSELDDDEEAPLDGFSRKLDDVLAHVRQPSSADGHQGSLAKQVVAQGARIEKILKVNVEGFEALKAGLAEVIAGIARVETLLREQGGQAGRRAAGE